MPNTLSANEERFRKETDALTIQAALDEAASSGVPVTVPRFNVHRGTAEWRIDRAIVLHSGSDLILDNALLIQETGSYDHIFTNEPGAKGIRISGEGFATLSGGRENRLRERTAGRYGLPDVIKNVMIYLRDARSVVLTNLRIEHQRYHAIAVDASEDVVMRKIDFFAYPHLPNMGGILLRNGTKNVLVDTVTGRTGDDTVTLRATKALPPSSGAENVEVENVTIRNILADPARASLVRIESDGGRKIRNVRLDTIMDASRFYEKKRSGSVLAFHSENARPAGISDVSDIRAENLYSRSERAVAVNGPFSDALIRNLMTFGDNIYAVKSATGEIALKDVVFDGIFYGAGSKPNNATSFISLQARSAKPADLGNVTGYEVKRLFSLSEEAL